MPILYQHHGKTLLGPIGLQVQARLNSRRVENKFLPDFFTVHTSRSFIITHYTMPDPLSIGAGIVAFHGVAAKILQKCSELPNATPQIEQILPEAEAFKAMVTLLQGLLLKSNQEALDNQRLLKVATLIRVLKGCTETFEQLEKDLDGLMEGDTKI